jgi:hypothetical protein
MTAIITLFDFYKDNSPMAYAPADYAASIEHVDAVMNALIDDRQTILAVDVKNEADRDYATHRPDVVKSWLRRMIQRVRERDATYLVTLGFHAATGGYFDPGVAAEFADDTDLVSLHYFLSEGGFEAAVKQLRDRVGIKPILLEEFGLHTLARPDKPCGNPPQTGCDDPHTERDQAAYYNALQSLSASLDLAGIMFWTLRDFSYILKDTQQSHHCQGVLRNGGVAICEVVGADYSEKPAAWLLRRTFDDRVRYLDEFFGYVTMENLPPPGWRDDGVAVLFRGYNPMQMLWSHTWGRASLSRYFFGQRPTLDTGTARSPSLRVEIDQFPFLVGTISQYQIRDAVYGSDAVLHIGVRENNQVTRLETVSPMTTMPYFVSVDLRQPPLQWHGEHSFEIVLQLEPIAPRDGYSATYELDNLGVRSHGLDRFIDDPLVRGVTTIKAIHVTELRARIDALRRHFGLQPVQWADDNLTHAIEVKAQHINELRTALLDTYDAAIGSGRSLTRPLISDNPALSAATMIKAIHVAELRSAVLDLEEAK